MCTYSAFHRQVDPMIPAFPKTWPQPSDPYLPWVNKFPTYPTPDVAEELKKLALRLDALDKKLGLDDCAVEAGAKQKFLDKLQKYIDAERPDAPSALKDELRTGMQRSQLQQSGQGVAVGAQFAVPNCLVTAAAPLTGGTVQTTGYMQNYGPNTAQAKLVYDPKLDSNSF